LVPLLTKIFRPKPLEEYKLEVTASERELGQIRDFITRVATDAKFPANEINSIKLALDEACSNVVRHAYRDVTPGPIRLRVLRRENELEFNIYDEGKRFDWKRARTPDLNHYVAIGKKGGLGIWFIRKLMDESSYSRTGGINHLRLVKRLKDVPAESPALLTEAGKALGKPLRARRLSVRIKYLFPVTASVAILVLAIFGYMFSNQARSMREEIMSTSQETAKRLAKESVNFLLRQDDLLLQNMVKNVMRTNAKLAYVFVTDTQNLIWAHSVTRLMFTPFKPGAGFRHAAAQNRETLVQKVRDRNNRLVHHVSMPIFLENTRLGTVHLGVREHAIQEDIKSGRRNAFLIFLIALVVSTGGAYFLMAFLINPIRKLTDGMLAVSEGRLDHRILIRTNDEFGQIARVFNEMTQRFAESQKNLIEQERIQQEMQVAQEIQHTLLPREVPQIEGYELASLYRSAKEVGGDYFDFVWVDDNILGVAVADVSGKGVPGSLVMTMIRTALRLEARSNRSAADVMVKVNGFVTRDMKKGMFVTMFYIVLDSRRRVINYSSAGHNPMILYREENDQIYFLKPRGFPLGIDLPDPELFKKSMTQEHVSLKKGDLLLVYTDGITEAMNAQRQQFGEKRLTDLVRYYHHLSAQEFIDKLSEEIALFTGDYPQSDDITFVAIKEKLQASEVETNLRNNLFDLIENQGLSIKEACKRLSVSPSTYYRFKRLRDMPGGEAALEAAAKSRDRMQHLALDDMVRIKDVVQRHPDLGPTRIVQYLASPEGGGVALPARLVYQALKRMGLSTREQRMIFAAKKKVD